MLSANATGNAFAKPRRVQVADTNGKSNLVSVLADADVTECGRCQNLHSQWQLQNTDYVGNGANDLREAIKPLFVGKDKPSVVQIFVSDQAHPGR